MLDIKLLRENKKKVIENLKKRIDFDTSIVECVLEIDSNWREKKKKLDVLKAKKNKESQAINKIKKGGGDIKKQIAKVKTIVEEISKEEGIEKNLIEERNNLLSKIPNLLDNEVPIGANEGENVQIRVWGKKPEFKFKVRTHQELCELNDWYELEKAAKNSGARFYYLKGNLVRLQLALYNFAFDILEKKGYKAIEVPPMLRRKVLGKSVSLEDFEEVIYKIEKEDLYLIGTSEHALAALHIDEIFNHKNLPIKYAGISQCFRKEAGVTKDSKGIFRVHNFNKIEQFVFCKPEDSDKFHKKILENAEEIFQKLGLHYQIIDICSGDIGNFASRKFDLEAWIPSQEKFREMVSASNYRDYGARRLNCRYQDEKGETNYVHTLNSTAIALSRAMVAILEQYQTKDGNVNVPEVLQSYIGWKKLLK